MNPALLLLRPLLLTIAAEGAVMLLLTRRGRYVYYSLLCNLLTNPPLNLLLWAAARLSPALYWPALGLLEAAAVLAEAGVLRYLTPWTLRRCLLVSLAMNAASFAAGLAIGG